MSKVHTYLKQSPDIGHYVVGLWLLVAIALSTNAIIQKDPSSAANPTCFLQASGSFTPGGSGTLVVSVDGANEGAGLLGAEIQLPYDTAFVETGTVTFSCPFDNCIDVSEKETLKFLAASATVKNGGKAVTKLTDLAKADVKFLKEGETSLNFVKCDVITEEEIVENRDSKGSKLIIAKESGGSSGAMCGNSKVENQEGCDDGNTKDGDGCSAKCVKEAAPEVAPVCGNKAIEGTEQCDDGNTVDGDGCSAKCNNEVANPVCGNSKVENQEECDDGNTKDSDGCSALCKTEKVAEAVPVCGNKAIEGTEQCDDGNAVDGDGCSAKCTTEAVAVKAVCGNVKVETGEQCDDGNAVDGDGCSALCAKEEPPVPQKTLVSIDVSQCSTCSTNIKVGETTTLNAWAYFSDSSKAENITSTATYINGTSGITGLSKNTVTGVGAGSGSIKASYTYEGVTKEDKITIDVAASIPSCPGPYHVLTPDNRCVWNCGSGTQPDNATNECGCQTGFIETGKDTFDRRVCQLPAASGGGSSSQDKGVTTEDETGGIKEKVVEVAEEARESSGGSSVQKGGAESGGEEEGDEVIEEGVRPAAPQSQGSSVPSETVSPREVERVKQLEAKRVEVQREAVKESEVVIRQKEVVKKPAVILAAPQQKQEVLSRIQVCQNQYPGVDFNSSADQDQDGLSNKTECYAATHPNRYDTDGDSCSDGAEINQLGTNPLKGDDCGQEAPVEELVTITDPQAGWILRELEVAGSAPLNTLFVTGIVFPADRQVITDLIDSLQAFSRATNVISANLTLAVMNQTALPKARAFLNDYGADYDYTNLNEVVSSLEERLSALLFDETTPTFEVNDEVTLAFEQLQTLYRDKVTVGTTSDLADMDLSGKKAKKFALNSTAPLENSRVYDAVAIASLSDGSTRSSFPVRFSLDEDSKVGKPIPRSIGNKSVSSGPSAFKNIWIGNVRADLANGIEIEIDQLQPEVSGDTEFGSQVFAVWNSVVLASSVISDSEEGAFSVQAPKELETDVGHRVTLYAVKADEGGNQARSESVNVFFRIKPPLSALGSALKVGVAVLLLGLAVVLIRRRLVKRGAGLSQVQKMEGLYTGKSAREAAKVFEEELDKAFAARDAQASQTSTSLAPSPKPAEPAMPGDEIKTPEITPEQDELYEKIEDKLTEEELEEEKAHSKE